MTNKQYDKHAEMTLRLPRKHSVRSTAGVKTPLKLTLDHRTNTGNACSTDVHLHGSSSSRLFLCRHQTERPISCDLNSTVWTKKNGWTGFAAICLVHLIFDCCWLHAAVVVRTGVAPESFVRRLSINTHNIPRDCLYITEPCTT